jgi:predicted transglutaminase-like cysteine proteinase
MEFLDQVSSPRDWAVRAGLALARIGIVFAALCSLTGEASARNTGRIQVDPDFVRSVGRAAPTRAWTQFCKRQPDECRVDRSQPSRISLSPEILRTLASVNRHVNATILAVTDQEHWGVLDRWDYPDDGLGDCEDIQLLKRRLLIKAGLPQRALRMTVVIDDQGEGHAVLMALTDRGDYILDNKRDAVLLWSRTGYTYLRREGTDGRAWIALDDRQAPAVTANR